MRKAMLLTSLAVVLLSVAGVSAGEIAVEPNVPKVLPAKVTPAKLDTGQTIYISRKWFFGGAVYKTVGEQDLRVVVRKPEGWRVDDKRPVVIFLYGGGFWRMCLGPNDPQFAPLLEAGCVVVLPQYRLTGKDTKIEDGLRDAKSIVRWVRKHSGKLGVDPNRVIGAGESAGGFLITGAALTPKHDEPGEDTSVSCKPDALFLFRPVVDITSGRAARYRKASRTGGKVSPIRHVTKNAPPTFIVQGSADGFLPETVKYAEKCNAAGARCKLVRIEGLSHTARTKEYYRAIRREGVGFLRDVGMLEPDKPATEKTPKRETDANSVPSKPSRKRDSDANSPSCDQGKQSRRDAPDPEWIAIPGWPEITKHWLVNGLIGFCL